MTQRRGIAWLPIALPAAALALAATGCPTDTGLLFDVAELAPGADCAFGGVAVRSGLDTDGDGVLGEGEITSTEVLCNGAPGENGEDGEDGGDGGNGKDGGDGEDGDPIVILPMDPPAAPAGAFTVDVGGGDASIGGGDGGHGGEIAVGVVGGSGGGHVKVFATGLADASFGPGAPTPLDFGPELMEVAADTTVGVASHDMRGKIAVGTYHLHGYDRRVHLWDGSDDLTVTGIHVAAGVTLTFEANGGDFAEFDLSHDLHNEGTLTTVHDGTNAVDLDIDTAVFRGAVGSAVVLTGISNTFSDPGGRGGDFYVYCGDDRWNPAFGLSSCLNEGSIDTSGGQGSPGGAGGHVGIYGEIGVVNTGDITTLGGDELPEILARGNSQSSSSQGGSVSLSSGFGPVHNSGSITASAGGTLTSARSGGDVSLITQSVGDVLNSGDITSNGSSLASSCGKCSGGRGGGIELTAHGGKVISSGALTAVGGDAGAGGYGGGGGEIELQARRGGFGGGFCFGCGNRSTSPAGNVEVSGSVRANGGAGWAGGSGGRFSAEVDVEFAPNNQEAILFGYTELAAAGGVGAADGGAGGFVSLTNATEGKEVILGYTSGAVVNYADVDVDGGAGGFISGGHGGSIAFVTDPYAGWDSPGTLCINHGDLTADGGDARFGGGYGWVTLGGAAGLENHGTIEARGGSGAPLPARGDDDGDGGDGGAILLSSLFGPVTNTARLDVDGGGTTVNASAGHAGRIELTAATVVDNSVDLAARGGAGGEGGNGGLVSLRSLDGPTANTAASLDVGGGQGNTLDDDGARGEVWIDGRNDTAAW